MSHPESIIGSCTATSSRIRRLTRPLRALSADGGCLPRTKVTAGGQRRPGFAPRTHVEAALGNGNLKIRRSPVRLRLGGAGAVFLAAGFLLPACPGGFAAEQGADPGHTSVAAAGFSRAPSLDLAAWPHFESATPDNARLGGNASPPGAAPSQSAEQQGEPQGRQARKKRSQKSSAPPGSPGHIFWVVPAFQVNYSGHFKPLTPRQKFHDWLQGVYDPLGLGLTAVEAGTLEYSSSSGFCDYGAGFEAYLKCLGSMEVDSTDSSFFGDFVFAVWWHQDPRYFRLGRGGFARRTLYAISRVFLTYNDSGKTVFYSSALSGTGLAAGMSNLYYPKQDRGLGHTMSRVAIDLGDTAAYNESAEFWPDIQRWLQRHF